MANLVYHSINLRVCGGYIYIYNNIYIYTYRNYIKKLMGFLNPLKTRGPNRHTRWMHLPGPPAQALRSVGISAPSTRSTAATAKVPGAVGIRCNDRNSMVYQL